MSELLKKEVLKKEGEEGELMVLIFGHFTRNSCVQRAVNGSFMKGKCRRYWIDSILQWTDISMKRHSG